MSTSAVALLSFFSHRFADAQVLVRFTFVFRSSHSSRAFLVPISLAIKEHYRRRRSMSCVTVRYVLYDSSP